MNLTEWPTTGSPKMRKTHVTGKEPITEDELARRISLTESVRHLWR